MYANLLSPVSYNLFLPQKHTNHVTNHAFKSILHHLTNYNAETCTRKSISECGCDTIFDHVPLPPTATTTLCPSCSLSNYACRRNRLARWILRPLPFLPRYTYRVIFFPRRRWKEKKEKSLEKTGASRGRVSTRATPNEPPFCVT